MDDTNSSGNTCMHIAAAAGHSEVMRMLMEFQASLNIRNQEGKCAIALSRSPEIRQIISAEVKRCEPWLDLFSPSEEIIVAKEGPPQQIFLIRPPYPSLPDPLPSNPSCLSCLAHLFLIRAPRLLPKIAFLDSRALFSAPKGGPTR